MIKIALVNPRIPLTSSTAPPFNLMYLSSYVKDIVDVKIIDEIAGQNVEEELSNFQPDWVGITVQTPCAYRAYKIAEFAKQSLDCKVIFGGHHVTALPDEAIKHADHVVLGEGEIVFKQLINCEINQRIIKGMPLANLDDVPPLKWDMIDFECYVQNKHNQPDTPFSMADQRTMSIITSRGCPYRCIFCWNSLRSMSVRYNSAERVCFEVDRLIEDYKVNSINFNDDEFLINRKRLSEMFQHFKKIGLVWGCQASAMTITEEIAEMLSGSGCVYVGIGFESGNSRILNILKAGSATVERNIKAIQTLKKYGIAVIGGFIFGTPSETYEEMMDTVKFITEQPIDSIYINSLTPYPASTLWSMVEDKLRHIDYSTLVPSSTPNNQAILCDTMSTDDFKRFLKGTAMIGKFKRGLRLAKLHHYRWLSLFSRHPFYPYFLARHPLIALKIIRRV